MQYNIYFRKENWERFKDEENKSGLINYLLETHYGKIPPSENISTSRVGLNTSAEDIVPSEVIKHYAKEADFIPKPPDPETGYPCCTKEKPCKHWVFDGANSVWTNTITGKTREVGL